MIEAASADAKRSIRKRLRQRRRALPAADRSRYAKQIADVVTDMLDGAKRKRVACYLPTDGEMDLSVLIERLWHSKHRVYLPALHGPRLRFLRYRPDTPLVDNQYGIPEPIADSAERCIPSALDTVLMPLVAFDHQGNRLGMGGGYYDRTFAFKTRPERTRFTPALVGVAYEFQAVDELPWQEWDVPLDGIVTEAAYQAF